MKLGTEILYRLDLGERDIGYILSRKKIRGPNRGGYKTRIQTWVDKFFALFYIVFFKLLLINGFY